MTNVYLFLMMLVSMFSAYIAMRKQLKMSSLFVLFIRMLILFLVLCVAATVILDAMALSSDTITTSELHSDSYGSHRRRLSDWEENLDQDKQVLFTPASISSPDTVLSVVASRLLTLAEPSKSLYFDYVRWPCAAQDTPRYRPRSLSPEQQIEYRETQYRLQQQSASSSSSLCGVHTLSRPQMDTFIQLIEHDFICEFWLDQLPIFAPIGFKRDDGRVYLFTHRHFLLFMDAANAITAAKIESDVDDASQSVELSSARDGVEVEFTYSVQFMAADADHVASTRHGLWKQQLMLVHGLQVNAAYAAVIKLYLQSTVPLVYYDSLMRYQLNGQEAANEQDVEANEDGTVFDPMKKHPSEIFGWKPTNDDDDDRVTLSLSELEQNEQEWRLDDDVVIEIDDAELLQKCGAASTFFVDDEDGDEDGLRRLRYFDRVQLWPIPQKFVLYERPSQSIVRRPQWYCNCGDLVRENEILASAIQRYESLIFTQNNSDDEEEEEDAYKYIKLVIDDATLTEQHVSEHTDEWYELVIPHVSSGDCRTIFLHARSLFGALRALETLSQLIYFDFDASVYRVRYVGYIQDWPFFQYRGVLLDTARHFQPPFVVKHVLDSMSYAKLNVLHWHVSDDQSWSFPIAGQFDAFYLGDLYRKSAFSASERYSRGDVREVLDYANARGIRVVPEFDTPAHVASWCKAFDICVDESACDGSALAASRGILDPSKPLTFEVVRAVYDAVLPWFNDTYVHIGNDEANYGACMIAGNTSNRLRDWWQEHRDEMRTRGIRRKKKSADFKGLQIHAFVMEKLFSIFTQFKHNKTLVSWDDMYGKVDDVIPRDTILMVWRSRWQKDVARMLRAGYRLIIAAPFYVDRWYEPLTDRYFADLWPQKVANMDAKLRGQILGGEACLWSEHIDASVLDAKLWPDAAATAENLWMGPSKIKSLIPLWSHVVVPRLKWFRCFMMARGVGFSPVAMNRSYPNKEFYFREPLWPFSCMDELDVRPIEQRLPDNDTREARKKARMAKQQQKSNINQRALSFVSIGGGDGVATTTRATQGWSLFSITVVLCVAIVIVSMTFTFVFLSYCRRNKHKHV